MIIYFFSINLTYASEFLFNRVSIGPRSLLNEDLSKLISSQFVFVNP